MIVMSSQINTNTLLPTKHYLHEPNAYIFISNYKIVKFSTEAREAVIKRDT